MARIQDSVDPPVVHHHFHLSFRIGNSNKTILSSFRHQFPRRQESSMKALFDCETTQEERRVYPRDSFLRHQRDYHHKFPITTR